MFEEITKIRKEKISPHKQIDNENFAYISRFYNICFLSGFSTMIDSNFREELTRKRENVGELYNYENSKVS
jgi:hypothetical protein